MLSNYRNLIFAVIAVICLFTLGCFGCFQSVGDVSPEVFVQQAVKEVHAEDLKHAADWRLGEEVNWVANHKTGSLTFMFDDGTIATAPMQIVGTYNITDGTFMWGWDHPNVKESLRKHAELALEFGRDHELPSFTAATVTCTKDDAWAFTATAAKLGNANGAYVGPTGNTLLFMTFGEVSLSKQQ